MSSSKQTGSPLANGQILRIPGVDRNVALHEQLYRYAEDLEQSIERCGLLEARNQELRDTCAWLEESRRELDEMVRRSRNIHLITDMNGRVLYCNPAAAVIAPPLRLAGNNFAEWVMPESLDNIKLICDDALADKRQGNAEWELHLRHASAEGTPLIAAGRAFLLKRNGEAHSLHWVLRNITFLRETEFDSQIADMVFRGAAEGILITDLNGEIMAVNPAFCQITGYSANEAIGKNPSFLSSGIQDAAFYVDLWDSLRVNGFWQGELYNRKKSGEMYPEWLSINAVRGSQGQVLSYVAMFSDVSRLLRAESQVSYLAHFDSLTGLANRHLFDDRLNQSVAHAKRSNTPFTLIFIDLDKFKAINDTHGHPMGDRVLQEAARRLRASFREIDTVARFGGDEFVVITPGLSGEQDINQVCIKVIAALLEPIELDGQSLEIGCSMGCAQYPQAGHDEITLLGNADRAMYRAKAAGGNSAFIHQSDAEN